MKFVTLLGILFDLLSQRKLTAAYLAEKYQLSQRTVHRYVAILENVVPVSVKRGRSGGICIADNYKLPVGFMTQDEYNAVTEALTEAYSKRAEERFLNAKRKLSTQNKTETKDIALSAELNTVLIDGGAWFDTEKFLHKLRIIEDCIQDKKLAEIEFFTDKNERKHQKIEPHVLVFKKNVWYVYAFSHASRDFQLFCLGNLFSVSKTEERFRKRPFKKEDIPLNAYTSKQEITVRLEINETALAKAKNVFGIENIQTRKDAYFAEITLLDDETLPYKLLSLGTGVKVLYPDSLQTKIKTIVQELSIVYP